MPLLVSCIGHSIYYEAVPLGYFDSKEFVDEPKDFEATLNLSKNESGECTSNNCFKDGYSKYYVNIDLQVYFDPSNDTITPIYPLKLDLSFEKNGDHDLYIFATNSFNDSKTYEVHITYSSKIIYCSINEKATANRDETSLIEIFDTYFNTK